MFPWDEILNFNEESHDSKEQINRIGKKGSTEALGDVVEDDTGDTPMDTPDDPTTDETGDGDSATDDTGDDSATTDDSGDDTATVDDPTTDETGDGDSATDDTGDDDSATDDTGDATATEPEPSKIEASNPHQEANSRELLSKKLLDLLGEIRVSISVISSKAEFESKTVVVNRLKELEDIVQKDHEIVNKTPKEDTMLRYAMAVKTYKQIIEEI